uniref:T2SSC domain-containing protein n=1 Tax=Ascaris lumbricoides TaxID=6252 RepID=A0A0M3HXK6_ASCLU
MAPRSNKGEGLGTEAGMRKFRWAAKISALKKDDWIKRITEWTSGIGKRSRGRPAMRSSELLLYAVLFVGIIAALPNYEFIGGESFGKYSTSFPRSPILIPDGTTHAESALMKSEPRQEKSRFKQLEFLGPLQVALTASFFDDERSQKRYEVEENVVGEDGKRRITLQGERLIADEVDIDSLNDVTVTIDDSAPDDYADFDKQVPSNGWPEHI